MNFINLTRHNVAGDADDGELIYLNAYHICSVYPGIANFHTGAIIRTIDGVFFKVVETVQEVIARINDVK